jgi:chemotaxis response regulator CheB
VITVLVVAAASPARARLEAVVAAQSRVRLASPRGPRALSRGALGREIALARPDVLLLDAEGSGI